MKHFEKINRSLAKTITFRQLVIISNSILIFLVTRELKFTLGVMVLTSISSTVLYFFHERVWNGIHWGKHSKK
jgi:uncharacterized membrane protein